MPPGGENVSWEIQSNRVAGKDYERYTVEWRAGESADAEVARYIEEGIKRGPEVSFVARMGVHGGVQHVVCHLIESSRLVEGTLIHLLCHIPALPFCNREGL